MTTDGSGAGTGAKPAEAPEQVVRYSVETLLTAAQITLDQHQVSSATGRCLFCGVDGPRGRRESAIATFSRYWRYGVPQRVKGATMPGMIGARVRGAGSFKWLGR